MTYFDVVNFFPKYSSRFTDEAYSFRFLPHDMQSHIHYTPTGFAVLLMLGLKHVAIWKIHRMASKTCMKLTRTDIRLLFGEFLILAHYKFW